MRFSYSSLRAWLTCERAWSYRYVDRLVSLRQASYFSVGKYAHALLEHALLGHANTGQPAVLDDATAKRIYKQLANDGEITLDETQVIAVLASARETVEWMRLDEWTTLILPDGRPAVEIADTVPWRGHDLEFRIDWIGRSHKTGMTWIVDHKSTRNAIDDTGALELDLQGALYREAVQALGVTFDGVLNNLLRVPAKCAPVVLKSGKLSRDKKKNAMRWPMYERAILERGEVVEDYADMREALQSKRWNMWRPDRTSEAGHAALLDEAEKAVERMDVYAMYNGAQGYWAASGFDVSERERRMKTLASRLTGSCDRCDFNAICSYDFDGEDIAPLLGVEYEPRDEASPWHGKAQPSKAGLTNYLGRQTQSGRFDVSEFQP